MIRVLIIYIRKEWQQLFWDAHAATVWDENGCVFLQDALQDLIAGKNSSRFRPNPNLTLYFQNA